MSNNNQEYIDKITDLYFKQHNNLYDHIFTSYHQFIEEIIPYILIHEKNTIFVNPINNIIYVHMFKIKNIRFKPATHDNDNEYKYPDQARKNHLNYSGTIIADISQVVEIEDILTGEKKIEEKYKENDIAIANIPIMVKSKYCSTYITKDIHNECKYDPGGYFLINGQEKVVMSIEKMVDNKILVYSKKDTSYDEGMFYSAQINSRKNEWSDNLQILTIKNRKDGIISVSTSQLIDIPLFVLLRALGLESDEEIISNITYDLNDTKIINLLRPSINYCLDENNNPIKTREEAFNYLINKINKNKRMSFTNEETMNIQKKMTLENVFRQDLLQHLGEDIPKKRAFLGLMTNKLLSTMLNRIEIGDRDALHNKRIETPGILLGQLFKQNWKKLLSEINKLFRKKNQNDLKPINVIVQIKPTTIEQGIKTALATGIWGMMRSKTGVAQAMQRLSWLQSTTYLRKILSPSLDQTNIGITSILHVNNNQYKFLCCLTGDTEILCPDHKWSTIKDLINNDSVITIHPRTLDISVTKIYNYFSIIPEKLFKLTTKTGKSIKATGDHPFLVTRIHGNIWKRLDELDFDNDELILYINNDFAVSKIESIEEIPVEPVYDFTTVSNNHSFVAAGFVTHNCVETPEGPKIGIHKTLAMMSTITTQNISQEKILKTIFNDFKLIKHPADVNPLNMNNYVKIFTNGNWHGVVDIKESNKLYILLKQKKREHILDKYVSILFDYIKKEIKIYYDGGRLIRPLFIVNEENKLNFNETVFKFIEEEIKKPDINKSWKRLLLTFHNLIEYEDIESTNFLMVANKVTKLEETEKNRNSVIEYTESSAINRYSEYRWVRYTHCEFPGWVMLGSTTATVPFLNYDYATRNIVFFSQAKQSIGIYLSSFKNRMDISQVLYHPQVPLAQTKAMQYNNTLDLPYGENAIVAIMSYTGLKMISPC
jgi:DNA-directed RNA polymerase II subunit RPB2